VEIKLIAQRLNLWCLTFTSRAPAKLPVISNSKTGPKFLPCLAGKQDVISDSYIEGKLKSDGTIRISHRSLLMIPNFCFASLLELLKNKH